MFEKIKKFMEQRNLQPKLLLAKQSTDRLVALLSNEQIRFSKPNEKVNQETQSLLSNGADPNATFLVKPKGELDECYHKYLYESPQSVLAMAISIRDNVTCSTLINAGAIIDQSCILALTRLSLRDRNPSGAGVLTYIGKGIKGKTEKTTLECFDIIASSSKISPDIKGETILYNMVEDINEPIYKILDRAYPDFFAGLLFRQLDVTTDQATTSKRSRRNRL